MDILSADRILAAVAEIEPLELQHLLDLDDLGSAKQCLALIDVREPEEHSLVKLSGSTLIPLMDLESELDFLLEVSRSNEKLVVYCRSGQRSALAVRWLMANGVANAFNLRGGINAYATEVDNSLEPY